MRGLVLWILGGAASAGCGRLAFDPRADAVTDTADDSATDAPAGPVLIQQAGNAANPASTLSVTLDGVPADGHMLVLVGAGHIAPLVTPTGGSSAWTRAAKSATNPNVEIWFGVANSSVTVTIDAGASTGYTLWVGEWAGLATTNTLDDAVATSGLASPASAGALTTSTPGDLVIFGVNDYLPNTYGAPTPGTWTELDTQQLDSMQTVWFQIATTAGALAPAVDETRHAWDAAIAAFRPSP